MAALNPGVPLVQAAHFPQKQPLPANPYDRKDTHSFEAYQQCLLSEAEANATNDQKHLMYARCLGYLISEAPDGDSRIFIVNTILECKVDPAQMNLLARFYIDHLLRLFRQQKGRTPAPSDHPSRQEQTVFFNTALEPAPRDHKTAKNSALRRDNYCCMVTGCTDLTSFDMMTPTQRQAFGVVGTDVGVTNFCHIFPPSINWDMKPEEYGHQKTTYSGNIWSIFDRYGKVDVLAELNGDNVHRLSNGLTLSSGVHPLFNKLYLWFEEVPGQINTYIVKTLYPSASVNRVVTFSTTTDLELPDSKYLRLHAAVCRVAHLSGAAGYLNLLSREIESTKVLANDGSSGDLLSAQLHQLQLRQVQPKA